MPPIFPLPLLYILLAISLILISPLLGVIFIIVGPLILYSWWLIRAFRERRLEYLAYAYIQLSIEFASVLALVRGKFLVS